MFRVKKILHFGTKITLKLQNIFQFYGRTIKNKMEFTYLWKCRTRICNRTWKTARISSSSRHLELPVVPPCMIQRYRWLWTYLSTQYCKNNKKNKFVTYVLYRQSITLVYQKNSRGNLRIPFSNTVNVFILTERKDKTRSLPDILVVCFTRTTTMVYKKKVKINPIFR